MKFSAKNNALSVLTSPPAVACRLFFDPVKYLVNKCAPQLQYVRHASLDIVCVPLLEDSWVRFVTMLVGWKGADTLWNQSVLQKTLGEQQPTNI